MNRKSHQSDSEGRRGALRALFGATVAGATGAIAPVVQATSNRSIRGASRTALVIGNSAYRIAPLENPVNDARLVSQTLTELGFAVQTVENATLAAMLGSMRQWITDSSEAQVRAFYFAGHGTQFRGDNYLVPIDLKIEDESEIRRKAISLTSFVDSLSAQREAVNFVIVDACRTDPNALLDAPRQLSRGINDIMQPGFAARIAPRGTVVAYSTSPGALAADSIGEGNSVFTQALTEYLTSPGLTVERMFKQVRARVMRATRNSQVPWESSSLIGDFCFLPSSSAQCGIDE